MTLLVIELTCCIRKSISQDYEVAKNGCCCCQGTSIDCFVIVSKLFKLFSVWAVLNCFLRSIQRVYKYIVLN